MKFDHARTLWAYLGTRAFEKVSVGVFVNNGRSINRLGEPGSGHNPFELVPTFELNVDYNSTRLLTHEERNLIVRQQIIRNNDRNACLSAWSVKWIC